MKKLIILLVTLMCFVFFAVNVSALGEAPKVTDDANIFSSTEERKLTEKIEKIIEEYNCDVGIYTVDFSGSDISDYEARDHAESFYNSNGYDDNGIILMIFFADNGNGWYMATAGECIDAFTDGDLDYIEERFLPYLKDGEYADAANSFVSDCKDELHSFYNFDSMWFFIALVIGVIVAFISVNTMKSQLKSVKSKPHAADYMKQGSMSLRVSNDTFLYKNVTRTAIPKSSSSGGSHRGGGGRSFGGSGGRF